MRLVQYEKEGQMRVGVKVENRIFYTEYTDMIKLIQHGEHGIRKIQQAIENGKDAEVDRLLAPVVHPGKILCGGINYSSHKQENPQAIFPKRPSVFSKLPSSIIGPEDEIIIPSPESQVDYEVELAFIIGKTAKNVSREEALNYVFGYTVLNDVSGRDLQFQLQHETIGKGADTFCPIGPEIVLTDEIPDPSKLNVSSYVNGERRQSSPTSEMLFDIPTLIEFISSLIKLNPGDLISTGTPAGVGVFRNPPVFLQPGDLVEVEVDAIGKLRNRVIAGWK